MCDVIGPQDNFIVGPSLLPGSFQNSFGALATAFRGFFRLGAWFDDILLGGRDNIKAAAQRAPGRLEKTNHSFLLTQGWFAGIGLVWTGVTCHRSSALPKQRGWKPLIMHFSFFILFRSYVPVMNTMNGTSSHSCGKPDPSCKSGRRFNLFILERKKVP